MGIQLETATENQEAKKRGRKARPRAAKTGSQKKNKKQNTPEKGICRTAFIEPSIFKHRAVFTGKRRQGERVAPGLGPGPAGGLKERYKHSGGLDRLRLLPWLRLGGRDIRGRGA